MFQVLSRRACLVAGASAAVLSATPAFAQTAAGADDTTVDVLIVTAQRREESANTVAMGIQAVRGETLERLHVTDARDLSAFAPAGRVPTSYLYAGREAAPLLKVG